MKGGRSRAGRAVLGLLGLCGWVLVGCGPTPEPRAVTVSVNNTRVSPVSLTWSGSALAVTEGDLAALSQQTGLSADELESFGLKAPKTLGATFLQSLAAELQAGDPSEFQRAYSGTFASVQRITEPKERYVHCALLQENFKDWIGWVDLHFASPGAASIAAQVKEACGKVEGAEGGDRLQRFQLAVAKLWGFATRLRPARERLNDWTLEKMQGLQASLQFTLDAAHSSDAPLLIGESVFLGEPGQQTLLRAAGRNCNTALSACRLTFSAKFESADAANAAHHALACGGNPSIRAELLVDGEVFVAPLNARYMSLECGEEVVRLPNITIHPKSGAKQEGTP